VPAGPRGQALDFATCWTLSEKNKTVPGLLRFSDLLTAVATRAVTLLDHGHIIEVTKCHDMGNQI